MNTLQLHANHLIENGWTIASMTDQQFIATKRKGVNGLLLLIGFVGLFFYLIPGLLVLILGYVARGTDTRIVTLADSQAWLGQKEQQAQELKAEEEARMAADERKYTELSASRNPLRFWYKMTSEQRTLLIIAITILAFWVILITWLSV